MASKKPLIQSGGAAAELTAADSLDFSSTGGITGLSASTANGQPLVDEQKGQLLSLPFSTTLGATDRVTAWIADHPYGAGAYTWNGKAWADDPAPPLSLEDRWVRAYIVPSPGAGLANIGVITTTAGTISCPSLINTSVYNRALRANVSTTATAGNIAVVRVTNRFYRGTSSSQGGFKIIIPFGLNALQPTQRGFIGISDGGAPTNVDPLTSTTGGKIGVAFNQNTGEWSFIHNENGTAPTVIALGANFPIDTTSWYTLRLSCSPGGATISYTLTNESLAQSTSGALSSNIPVASNYMAFYSWMTNNTTAAIATYVIGNVRMEHGE